MSPSPFSLLAKSSITSNGQEATMKDHRTLEDLKIKYQAELERIESDLKQACQQAESMVKTSDPDKIAEIIAKQEAEYQAKWNEFAQNVHSVKQDVEAINARLGATSSKEADVF